MSTNSEIAMTLPDGSVISTYCHFDGYIRGVGLTLVKKYKNPEDIADLIKGGVLRAITDGPEYLDDEGSKEWISVKQLVDNRNELCCEYVYLYDEDEWHVLEKNDDGFFLLKDHADIQLALLQGK